MADETTFILENKFLTTKEIEIYDDTDLFRLVRKVPANTLLSFDRKVIRKRQRMAQIIEPDGTYVYFKYSDSTRSCDHCYVKEDGLDVLNISPEKLNGINITVQKKEFKDSDKNLEKSEILTEPGKTHLMLKDKNDKKDIILHVTINNNDSSYELMHLEPETEFFILSDTSFGKGKPIIFENGYQAVLFHKEGLYTSVEDDWAKFYKYLSIAVGLTILFGGIFGIAASTGYFVIVGFIMIPVTFILTAIVVAPIIWGIEFLRRFF